MILEAFAKINWSLDITGLRNDGYHLMDMLMQPISLCDDIHLGLSDRLTISTGGYPPSRADESNLAYRAALCLRNETGCGLGVAIHLHKRIPIGAGLGGGSADAAAVLLGLNQLWHTGLSTADLERLGLTLGADVPFFIRGGLTRTRGIGEELICLPCRSNYWLLVLQPCQGLSTADVFRRWHPDPSLPRPQTDQAAAALESGNLSLLCRSISNVLQPVAEQLRPKIAEACAALRDLGAVTALMTGSGSAVFGVFQSSAALDRAYSVLSRTEKSIFRCHSQHDAIRMMEE